MIELPEATVISQQMAHALSGKRIEEAVRGYSPHKFAFYTLEVDEYVRILTGTQLGQAYVHGSWIVQPLGSGHVLVLGGGGERILYHRDETTLPKKHQLLLRFEDDTYLTVSVQGWGSVELHTADTLAEHPYMSKHDAAPLDSSFALEQFADGFRKLESDDKTSVKYYLISEPGVLGIGNGYLQDILYHARLHPRRKAASLARKEVEGLYTAMQRVLEEAVDLGGRDTERDLYNERGNYVRLMDSRTHGQPCSVCGEPIIKISYLGGACYLCPVCQPAP
jgi:formamidopyrimidine-DNA glycosylase